MPLLRMHTANMNDSANMNESKDATQSLQFPAQEEKPTHTCTQDTSKKYSHWYGRYPWLTFIVGSPKYSHWYGRYPWLAFIIGSPLLFLALAVINCFAFYLLPCMCFALLVCRFACLPQVLWGETLKNSPEVPAKYPPGNPRHVNPFNGRGRPFRYLYIYIYVDGKLRLAGKLVVFLFVSFSK